MDKKLEIASKLSTDLVKTSLPASLLEDLEKIGICLSVPWTGILIGLTQPIQYAMDYTNVTIEKTDWVEQTIFWPLMHMPSATRKSVIYNFLKDIINSLEDEEDMIDFKVCETTFEKLGLLMQNNSGKMIWQFDEARHFFAQLGLYQKTPSRDEAALLSLYDGQEWTHSSAKGTQFAMKRTKLSLGGLTQTAHVISLFKLQEQMDSGLIPRFFTVMLRPVHTSIRQIGTGSVV